MHRAIAVAIRQGRFNRANPFAMVDRPKVAAPETRSLSLDEARGFIAATAEDRFESLWILLLTCGMRLGEALALRWSDVDLKSRTIAIRRSRSQVGGPHDTDTKTRSSRREVVFGALAAAALERRRQSAEKEPHRSEVIFCTSRGTTILRENLRRSHFKQTLERAKIKGITIRELRHTSISIGLGAGVPVKAMSGRSGHANSRTTLDRYTHVLAGQDRSAADAIDAAIAPTKRAKRSKAKARANPRLRSSM
jgi:integrase